MIRIELFLGVLVFALAVYCLIDVIGRGEDRIRHLPKVWWILLVLLFPLVGSIAWLAVGREPSGRRPTAHERPVPQFPEYDRPGRAAASRPRDDEEFLRQVRERAEQQRRTYREQRLRREAEERARRPGADRPPVLPDQHEPPEPAGTG